MSKRIVVFGAGKSATCLIDYLVKTSGEHGWQLTVADSNLPAVIAKLGGHAHTTASAVNVENDAELNGLVQLADIVISLLPPALHFMVAKACVAHSKDLLTASYTDDAIRGLRSGIDHKNLLFLCEMGLDPGIDHMSAMQLIDRIKKENGRIQSFISHCGGLVAAESDDNPWHYKISWNPRNVVMAGKAGAVYRQQGATQIMEYRQLFNSGRTVAVPGLGQLAWYPNRDSLGYIPVYGLETADNFIRTTLRHPAFTHGWQYMIDWQLTSETLLYNTDGLSLKAFFALHFSQLGLTRQLEVLMAQDKIIAEQMVCLGFYDDSTLINKGRCSAMDAVQFALEKKLVLQPADKDMIVMLHEIEYLQNGRKKLLTSSLLVKGDDNLRTAMAKTVGLPLGIATKLILQGRIKEKGLHIPVIPGIYNPVLAELQQHGIAFSETETTPE
jgi:saccharopine dehydrogenase-like NADP-dependent oxidoreductase